MVVLLQEFCNLLIEKAFAYLIPEELLKMELEEGVERVRLTLRVMASFKQSFHQHREGIGQCNSQTAKGRPWDFPSSLVFHRTDCILQRLHMIVELFTSALDFIKLEKVEVGGSRGKIFSDIVFVLTEEFQDSWRFLRERKYDPLDCTKQDFLTDYSRFMEQNRDFDQRLGTVLTLAFQQSTSLESVFKLLEIFSPFLERPRIREHFAPNSTVLLGLCEEELGCCQQIFQQQRENMQHGCAVQGKNLPPTAGLLVWAQQLQARILACRSNLYRLTHISAGERVLQQCEKLLEDLDLHDESVLSCWADGLELLYHTHLQEPLLSLHPDTGLLEVNFHLQLRSTLREVKYLDMLKHQNIPRAALELYSRKDSLYMFTHTLCQIVQWSNTLQSCMREVEAGLVEGEMERVREQLQPALGRLNWGQDDLWDYISHSRELLHGLHSRIQSSQRNLEILQDLMRSLNQSAFITRRSGHALLDLHDIKESVDWKYGHIATIGEKMHQLVEVPPHARCPHCDIHYQKTLLPLVFFSLRW
ncbi:hypothetical protein GJAV_G00208410 [Gymnothorax javanicus]|nr:hypothetical protein GJAV_G00208410 [Gymnothorax javanicus]